MSRDMTICELVSHTGDPKMNIKPSEDSKA